MIRIAVRQAGTVYTCKVHEPVRRLVIYTGINGKPLIVIEIERRPIEIYRQKSPADKSRAIRVGKRGVQICCKRYDGMAVRKRKFNAGGMDECNVHRRSYGACA